ncbi:YadA-like family protein [Phascolarctobacterium sp.]|uniref:beta strand repeat-containing protein n=1 Tax=Phascolarctobacterium sp. TaxID=2049039 RepID=UPI0030646C82
MSKRDMRARRLLAAVLLAMSVQVWYAQPLWAAQPAAATATESTAAGNSADTTAKTENKETDNKADKDENTETNGTEMTIEPVTDVAPIGYSSRSASPMTASNDGIMPLADQDINGALTNVTSINGADLKVESYLGSIAFGTGATLTDLNGTDAGIASAFGSDAKATANYASAFGSGAEATASWCSAFGSTAKATGQSASAFGMGAEATIREASAFGAESVAAGSGSVALGYKSVVAVSHTGSVAIGASSATNAANQVAFGKMTDPTTYRSLAGIKDIAMTGALTGLKSINGTDIGTILAGGVDLGNITTTIATKASAAAGAATTFSVDNATGNVTTAGTINGVSLRNGSLDDIIYINGADLKTDGSSGSMVFGAQASYTNTATGTIAKEATAFGTIAMATGMKSNAFGYDAQATGGGSIAIGTLSRASGSNSNAFGYKANAGHQNSVAIGNNSATSADKQVAFGKMTDLNSFRSLAGIKDIALTGAINGVGIGTKGGAATDKDNVVLTQGANTIDITKMNSDVSDVNTAITNISYDAGTGTTVDGVAIKSGVVTGVTSIAMNGKITGVTAGTADTDAVNFGQLADYAKTSSLGAYATTETMTTALSTKADASDMTTKLAAKANADATGLSDGNKTAWKGALGVDTLASAVAGKASQTDFTALNNIVTATDTGLAAAHTKADANAASINAMDTDYKAADSALAGKTATLEAATTGMTYVATPGSEMTTFAGGVTAKSLTVKVGGTEYGMSSTGALSAASVNNINVRKSGSDIMLDTINLSQLANSGVDLTNITGNITVKNAGTTTFNVDNASGNVTGGAYNGVGIGTKGGTAVDKDNVVVGTVDITKMNSDVSDVTAKTTNISYDAGTGTIVDGVAIKSGVVTGVTSIAMNGKITGVTAGTADSDAVNVGQMTTELGKKADKSALANYATNTALAAKADANATGLSAENKTAWKTALGVDTLASDVAGKASQTDFTALNNKVTATDTGLAAAHTKADANAASITAMDTDYKAADSALAGKTAALEAATTGMTYADTSGAMTTFAGGVTANSFTVGATGFGFSAAGDMTAKTVNGVSITGTDAAKNASVGGYSLKTISDNIKTLQENGGATSANTVGIAHGGDVGTVTSITTIEKNTKIMESGITTNAIAASGTVRAAEFVEGSTKLADKYAAIGDAYTAEKAAVKADKTYVDNNFAKTADVNTELGKKVDISDYNSKIGTLEAADSDLAGRAAKLEKATTGMTYDATSGAMTTFAGGVTANSLTIGSVTVKAGELGGLTKLNNAAISVDGKGITIDGIGLKDLSDKVTALENSGGGSGFDDTNVKGIKRTASGGDGNNDTTTIEDATSFTASGMKTSNLEAATAAIGGVTFAANGVMNNVASINGISFANGKVGGVTLSGGKVDGVDVGALKNSVDSLGNRVTNIENSGGGGGSNPGTGGANTAGITRPDNTHTTIEGNTTIGADGVETNNLVASGSITIAKGETNQTVIDENGIHVGQNSSVVNDTDGFITDKGLYIGVDSSSNLGSAKFSVDPSGNMNSQAGNFGFSNTSTGGAKFTDTNSTAHSGGSVIETTIKGNTVETGRIDTDELWVGGNKVELAGTTVQPGTHINNHLEGNDASGNAVTNDFTTSALNGTTQSAEQVSADGKNTIKTTNNTSATGTGITTTRTDVDSSDNTVVQKSELTTNESGMSLNTSNKVTDKEGKVTSSSSGATNMTGDSLTVSKTTVTKDGDGNDVTKTSSTTVDSGEVTLNREDGSSIRVGDAIEGLQSDVQEMGSRINEMGTEIKEVGALSAALAGLHPQPQNANTKADFAMAMGSYEGKQALAVGAFYKPDKRTMLSVGASTTSSKHMMNMGISIALDRMPEEERKAQEQAGADNETLNKVLERLASLEQDNQRLVADNKQMALENAKRDAAYAKLADNYNELKEKYSQEKPAEKADDTAAESAEAKAKSE